MDGIIIFLLIPFILFYFCNAIGFCLQIPEIIVVVLDQKLTKKKKEQKQCIQQNVEWMKLDKSNGNEIFTMAAAIDDGENEWENQWKKEKTAESNVSNFSSLVCGKISDWIESVIYWKRKRHFSRISWFSFIFFLLLLSCLLI